MRTYQICSRAFVFASAIAAVSAAACKPVQGPDAGTIEAGVSVATGLCTLLEGIDDSGVLRTICATVEEIAAVAAFILTLRPAGGSDAGLASAACVPLPGTDLCATSAERAKAVSFLVKLRATRLVLATDSGGVRK
jgi:hypothetical protein